MSPQPSPVPRFALEDAGETASLIFGDGSGPPLTIPKTLIAKIWAQVNEGVRILSHGGAEVGGLLVGPKSRRSGVVLDRIIPLTIEYKYGPSFRMSASDLAKVAVTVASVQADPSKAVVGFYRSQTRGTETSRESDREILHAIEQAHTSFTDDFLCHVVLAPVSRSEMSACVSMRNGENWDTAQFTLGSHLLSAAQRSSAAQPVSAPAQTQVSRPLEASLAPPVPRAALPLNGRGAGELEPHPSGRSSKLLYAAAGLVVLAGAAGAYRWIARNRFEPVMSGRVQTSLAPLRMGFSANREGPVWKLWWDRGAIEVMKPSGAVLAIKDGSREQQLNLTPADLSNGTIFYTPQSGDLAFSLQLERGGATPVEEHIRILEGPGGIQEAAAPDPPKQPADTNIVVPAKANSRSPAGPSERPRATSSGAGKETPVNPVLSAVLRANRAPSETAVEPTILRDVPPGLSDTTQPPAVAFAVPVAPRLAPPVDRETAPSRPPVQQPAPDPGPAAAKSAPLPEPAKFTLTAVATPGAPASATVPAPVKPNYVPPKPVQQVRPLPPPKVDANGTQIQIHLEIDALGKVTNATPVDVTAASFPLVPVSVRAARAWKFEPAKLNGRSVPSEMDLVFRF